MNVQNLQLASLKPDAVPLGRISGGAAIGRRAMLERFTFALPIMTVLTFAIQLGIAALLHPHPLAQMPMTNSIAAGFFVNTTSALIYREFRRTPGTRRFSFILPSFALPCLVLAGLLLGLRLYYNNYVLLAGVLTGVTFLYLISAFQRPTSGRRVFLVPGSKTKELAGELAFLNTEILRSPDELLLCGQGAVVADLGQDLPSEWERGIARAVLGGIPVYNVKQVRESLTGKVQIEALSENSFGSLVPSLSYLLLKRAIDLAVSIAALLVLAVPMLVIALVIRFTSPGPAFYRHRRIGYRGREFQTLKFRTMRTCVQDDEDLESQKTIANDSRITAVGRFLRKTRLDELPQLINVVRGEMSLIGPRPEALALSRWYDEHLDFYQYRHVVRPGITGWAQVNQGHVTELDDVYVKLQYDFYYIKNVSGWLDMLIALRTMVVMVSFRGAR